MALRVFIALFLLLVSFCSSNRIKLEDRSDSTRENILKQIPIGTNSHFAYKIMEDNDFLCKEIKNGQFLELKNINYIYCDREDIKGILLARRWQIAIILSSDKVNDIVVSTGLVGP